MDSSPAAVAVVLTPVSFCQPAAGLVVVSDSVPAGMVVVVVDSLLRMSAGYGHLWRQRADIGRDFSLTRVLCCTSLLPVRSRVLVLLQHHSTGLVST